MEVGAQPVRNNSAAKAPEIDQSFGHLHVGEPCSAEVSTMKVRSTNQLTGIDRRSESVKSVGIRAVAAKIGAGEIVTGKIHAAHIAVDERRLP